MTSAMSAPGVMVSRPATTTNAASCGAGGRYSIRRSVPNERLSRSLHNGARVAGADGCAAAARICAALQRSVRLDLNRLRISLVAGPLLQRVPSSPQRALDVIGQPRVLEDQDVGQMLVMQAWSGGCARDIHVEVDDMRDDLRDGSDDRGAAGRTRHELQPSLGTQNDGWRHRGQHPFARLNRVWLALEEAELVGQAGVARSSWISARRRAAYASEIIVAVGWTTKSGSARYAFLSAKARLTASAQTWI